MLKVMFPLVYVRKETRKYREAHCCMSVYKLQKQYGNGIFTIMKQFVTKKHTPSILCHKYVKVTLKKQGILCFSNATPENT